MSASVHSDKCEVYFCTRPIQMLEKAKSASGSLSSLSSLSRSVSGGSWDKHWLVAFDRGDDEVLICEAENDDAGNLTGKQAWKKKAAFEATFRKKHLGRHCVPEGLLMTTLKKMCDCGHYHATENNCQTWVLKLLRQLGIKRPDGEYHAAEIVEGVNKVIAPLTGATGLGINGFLGSISSLTP